VANGDQVQGAVGLAVAAVVEPVAGGLSGRRGDRACAAERGERAFAAEPVDVLSGGDEQPAGVAGRDPEQLCGTRRDRANPLLEPSIVDGDLRVERADALGDERSANLAA
jgi:hypothetical protein